MDGDLPFLDLASKTMNEGFSVVTASWLAYLRV